MNLNMDDVRRITSNRFFKECEDLESLLYSFAKSNDLYMHANYTEPFDKIRIFVSNKKCWTSKSEFLREVLHIIAHINFIDSVPDWDWDTKMLTMIEVDFKKGIDENGDLQDMFSMAYIPIKKYLEYRYNIEEDTIVSFL